MEIFEIAQLLGKTLKEDERLKRLEEAKKQYEESPELGKMMVEYEVQQKALENEVVKPEASNFPPTSTPIFFIT